MFLYSCKARQPGQYNRLDALLISAYGEIWGSGSGSARRAIGMPAQQKKAVLAIARGAIIYVLCLRPAIRRPG